MHLTDEQLQRLLHGEEQTGAVEAHLAGCTRCEELLVRVRQDEGEILDLLQTVDLDPPGMDPEMLAALARSRRKWLSPTRYRWAAVILLVCVLGGVAYALPGSPLKAWLASLLAAPVLPSTAGDSLPSPPEIPAAASGVALDPGEKLVIVFEAPPPGALARVTLTDELQVMVQAPIGQARFTAETDRLLVSIGTDSIQVDIRIPRSAPRVEIFVGTRRVLAKNGTAIVSSPPPGADSVYLVPLAP